MEPRKLRNLINGEWVESRATEWAEVRNPATDEVIAIGPLSEPAEVDAAVVYTENGSLAREFVRRVDVGQVGINVGTPAPVAFYAVGGRKQSFFGPLRGRANDAIAFYTDKKTVVTTWHTP